MAFTFLKGFLIFIEILTSILLIGIILLQRSKGQGPGGLAFGVGVGETIFGSQAGNVLTRATIVLGTIFLVNTAALSFIYASHRGRGQTSVVDRTAPTSVPAPRPAQQPIAAPPMDTPAPIQETPATPSVPAPAPAAPAPTVPAPTVPAPAPMTP